MASLKKSLKGSKSCELGTDLQGNFDWYQREDNLALIREVAGAECLLEMSRDIQA